MQNKFFTYSIIFLLIVPIFGFNFFISLMGNILLLLFLIPLLIILLTFLGFQTLKSKIKNCQNCGIIITDDSTLCPNCGLEISINQNLYDNVNNDLSKDVIEIEAEEIN